MARVFVTGATGLLGRALVAELQRRGDEVVALARSEPSAAALAQRGVRVVRGEVSDAAVLAAGMSGCDVAFNLAGVNSLCVHDPAPMRRANIEGAVAAVHAARQAGLPRLVHTSSAATIGEPAGTIANEWTDHRGWYLSMYERTKTEGERAALEAARQVAQDVVCVNPSSVQGPGRAAGTGRFLLAFLDGRLKVFVNTNLSLVDIGDCVQGHLLAAERGASGQRYLLSGIRLTMTDALSLAAEVAGVARRPRLVPRAWHPPPAHWSKRPSGCAGGRLRSVARWCARCCTGTATTAAGPSASWAFAIPPPTRRWRGPWNGRGRRGCCAAGDSCSPAGRTAGARGWSSFRTSSRMPPGCA